MHADDSYQLLADDYARQGYYTYVVDYLNGDAVHKDAMNTGKVSGLLIGMTAVLRPLLAVRLHGMARQAWRGSDSCRFGPRHRWIEGARCVQVCRRWVLLWCTYSLSLLLRMILMATGCIAR